MRIKRREATRRNHVTATTYTSKKKPIAQQGSLASARELSMNPGMGNRPVAPKINKGEGRLTLKQPRPIPVSPAVMNRGNLVAVNGLDALEVKVGRKQTVSRLPGSFLESGAIVPAKQRKRQTAHVSGAQNVPQTFGPSQPPSHRAGKVSAKQISKRKASGGLGHPSDEELASRPDNRFCLHCPGYVHKDRLAAHFQKKHGMSVHDVVVAVAAANLKPKDQNLPKRQISSPVQIADKAEPKLKVETPYAQKRREMKEAFREIDRLNFPRGARLTSNSSGSLPRAVGSCPVKQDEDDTFDPQDFAPNVNYT